MARGGCTFRERDLKTAIKAAVAAGFDVGAVEITRDGTIRLLGDNGEEVSRSKCAADDLDRELAEFEARLDQR